MDRIPDAEFRERGVDVRRLFDVSPDMFVIRDGTGRWLFANGTAKRLFGIDEREYAGAAFQDLAALFPSYGDLFLRASEADEETWRSGDVTRREVAIPDRDGAARTFDVIRVPFFSKDGTRNLLVAMGRDITEYTRTLANLRRSEDMLKIGRASCRERV